MAWLVYITNGLLLGGLAPFWETDSILASEVILRRTESQNFDTGLWHEPDWSMLAHTVCLLIELEEGSVAWVRERTIPNERPPLLGDVSDNFCG
jgi:hypothetical protein